LTLPTILWEVSIITKNQPYKSFFEEINNIDNEVKKHLTFQELQLISTIDIEYMVKGELKTTTVNPDDHWWYYAWPTYALRKNLVPKNMISPAIDITNRSY
jgi:hypothetical protein